MQFFFFFGVGREDSGWVINISSGSGYLSEDGRRRSWGHEGEGTLASIGEIRNGIGGCNIEFMRC